MIKGLPQLTQKLIERLPKDKQEKYLKQLVDKTQPTTGKVPPHFHNESKIEELISSFEKTQLLLEEYKQEQEKISEVSEKSVKLVDDKVNKIVPFEEVYPKLQEIQDRKYHGMMNALSTQLHQNRKEMTEVISITKKELREDYQGLNKDVLKEIVEHKKDVKSVKDKLVITNKKVKESISLGEISINQINDLQKQFSEVIVSLKDYLKKTDIKATDLKAGDGITIVKKETDKKITYKISSNEAKSKVTVMGGSSGKTTLASLNDVLISSITDLDLLQYNDTTSKWENKSLSASGLIYDVADTSSIDLTNTSGVVSGVVLPAGVDHNSLANLTTGDPHTQYAQDSDLTAYLKLDGSNVGATLPLNSVVSATDFQGYGGVPITASKGLKSPYTNTVVVDAGGRGDYTSVKSACDYVATQSPSVTNWWTIVVNVGEYTEDPFTVPSNTTLWGRMGTDLRKPTITPSANLTSGGFITTTGFVNNITVTATIDATATADCQMFLGDTTVQLHGCSLTLTNNSATYEGTIAKGLLTIDNCTMSCTKGSTGVTGQLWGLGNSSIIRFCSLRLGTADYIVKSTTGRTLLYHSRIGSSTGTVWATTDLLATGAGSILVNNVPYKTSSGTITQIDKWYPTTAAVREAPLATDTPLILKGATSQTANLLEVQNSSGTVLASFSPESANQGFTIARTTAIGSGTMFSFRNTAYDSGLRPIAGLYSQLYATHTTGTKSLMYGSAIYAYNNNAGTITSGFGLVGNIQNDAGGTIGSAYGLSYGVYNAGVGTITKGVCVRAVYQNYGGGTVSEIRGLALTDWSNSSGTTTLSYGIYADTSIDLGATKYFIYSLSTSPSLLSGALTVDGNADAIQLKVQGHSSQTANLTEWQNSSATVLSSVSSLGFFGIGVAPVATSPMYINKTFTPSTGTVYGEYVYLVSNPTAISTEAYGLYFSANHNSGSQIVALKGMRGVAVNASGDATPIYGIEAQAQTTLAGSGTTYGISISAIANNTSTSAVVGGYFVGQRYSTVGGTASAGQFVIEAPATGVITSGYGVFIKQQNVGAGGSITSGYGLYIDDQNGASTNYAIYTKAGAIHAGDKIEFTQTDGNEYIDSLNDGYLDYGATTGHRFLTSPVSTVGRKKAVTTKTTTYTALTTDEVIVCNSTTAFTVTLPVASGLGQTYTIKNINTGVITVSKSGDTIDGEASQTLNQYDSMQVCDTATNQWSIL